MGEIVNLKRYKKRAARARDDLDAGARRAEFGRSKSERQRDQDATRKHNSVLDQHRLGEDDA